MTIHSDRTTPVSDRMVSANGGAVGHRSLPRETLDQVLDSDRRSEVIRCLLAADGPIAVRTLVGRLADAEDDATLETTIHQLRQRIHVSLCRTHLPLLDEQDIVTYDRVRSLVGPGANLAAFESVLEYESLERPITGRLG
ncbi:DUF7344 domain-containing protein [Natrinema halophilum]|uniref:DUF7344 domain-containing protein n=1 Tax=Natrinema halophilum TaxID=1699371 RepID=A0A7D5H8Z0_9EURY|nr:hypothetical protein [Natrinema halophilum]QLG49895.1 hypothetical protein HYG82_14035 [Natrinema halophilum]